MVERDDGVRYRLEEGVAGAQVPHDLVHFVVERQLGEDRGFWGAVAAGAVFASMKHLDGRRPPRAEHRSRAALAERGSHLTRAELLAGLVQDLADAGVRHGDEVRRRTREALSTQVDVEVDPVVLVRAADELQRVGQRWRELAVGEELVIEWVGRLRR
ncbi:hypothetical protein [Pseudonocardia spinosispora]|uniref:hypothetical protein n=1 Tax=Pseudonocardia spinosispora TaxID=103441 RepID=UPI0012EC90CA|nr:hypothetical protein [Pseudonocardia spinosispora]